MLIERGFLVTGDNARDLYRVLIHGVTAMRRSGHRLSPEQSRAVDEIGRIALTGRGDVLEGRAVARCRVDPISEPLTTSEVAKLLGVGPRHARRYAATLSARRIGGRLVWDKSNVIDYLEGRKS